MVSPSSTTGFRFNPKTRAEPQIHTNGHGFTGDFDDPCVHPAADACVPIEFVFIGVHLWFPPPFSGSTRHNWVKAPAISSDYTWRWLTRIFHRFVWGAHAPRVLLGAPRPKHAPTVFTTLSVPLTPKPSARRRREHAGARVLPKLCEISGLVVNRNGESN